MIRINLIAATKGKRRARPGLPDIPNVGVLLFVLLLVIESAVLYSMHASANDEAERYSHKLAKVKRDLASAKKTHAQLTAVRKEVVRLRTQALLFEELEAEKKGPVGALTFLSFILKPRDEASHSSDELKKMEAAGWRVSWDANRAWFTYVGEAEGVVTLRGAAIHHDDVAEVLRRLESSAYFRNVRLVWQERRHHRQLNKDFIVFTLKADLLYLIVPYLTADQRAEKRAAAEAARAEAAKKGADASIGGANQATDAAAPSAAAAAVVKSLREPPVIIDQPLHPPAASTAATSLGGSPGVAPATKATATTEGVTLAPNVAAPQAGTPPPGVVGADKAKEVRP